jgi:hypothetical protein
MWAGAKERACEKNDFSQALSFADFISKGS